MSIIRFGSKEITCKIVYYGPGRAGKTTNLQYLYSRIPATRRSELVSLATETDKTLFFDYMPVDVGNYRGFTTKFQLYTVPGQVFYEDTRKLVLKGADGVVFVADSQRFRYEDNIFSLENMFQHMEENGLDIDEIPIVLQYNKRDLDDICTIEELQESLNANLKYSYFEAIAVKGIGVPETFKAIGTLVLKNIREKLGL
uniref:Gliding-motility protein MglA n=1 Tax=candidate division WOR-3 bacterium TaxID=2052148 RepID=A0A7C4UFR2_UNCW3